MNDPFEALRQEIKAELMIGLSPWHNAAVTPVLTVGELRLIYGPHIGDIVGDIAPHLSLSVH
jgi:hypothetical protein